MKNVVLLSGTMLIVATSLMSCKKDYSCECTKTYTSGNTSISQKQSVIVYKETKKRATQRCSDNESSGTDLAGNYTVNCDIK